MRSHFGSSVLVWPIDSTGFASMPIDSTGTRFPVRPPGMPRMMPYGSYTVRPALPVTVAAIDPVVDTSVVAVSTNQVAAIDPVVDTSVLYLCPTCKCVAVGIVFLKPFGTAPCVGTMLRHMRGEQGL